MHENFLVYSSTKILFNHIAPHVRLQGLGDTDALGRLEVFEQGCHDARQGERGAVERMGNADLLILCAAITALQAVGLIGVEIAYGRQFKPTALCFLINLEVVADGRGERLVATTKQKYAVWQFQFFQQAFHMCEHFLMRLLRMFRLVDTHNFYFRKLM